MTSSDVFSAAVASPAQTLLVIAPPGCGKTELLARRAELLIPTLQPHQRILALTFSNKAKSNLGARLVAVLGAERARRYVAVRNFHGHAAEVLRSHGRTLSLDPSFSMPDKNTQASAIAPFVDGLSTSEAAELNARIEDDLRNAKQGPYDDEEVLAVLEARALDSSVTIETERQASGTPYFDDLLRHAQRLLGVDEVSNLYQNHYGAILVDEFQDLSPQQLDIALRSCSHSRTFVGDPLQGIYSWTGARPREVEQRLRELAGEPLGLGLSYRSSPRVLDVLNNVSVGLGGRPLESFDPDAWHEGGVASGLAFRTGSDEAAFIEETCRRILDKTPTASIGIICRSGWRRQPIDAVFNDSALPSIRWDLAIDNALIVDLIREAASRLGGNPALAALRDELRASIDQSDADTLAEVADALEQLSSLADGAGSIAAALAQVRTADDSDAPIAPGVHLLNAHTGKGQQFDWVFVPGFEKGNIPSFLAKGKAQLDEEHRVLLVMLSRARHGLVLTSARSLVSKAGRNYDTSASPWVSEVRPSLVAERTELLRHIESLPNDANW